MSYQPNLVPPSPSKYRDPNQYPDRLLDSREVCAVLGITLRTLQRWTVEGRIPQPIRFGPRRNKWRWSTVARLLDQLEQAGTLA